MSRLREKNDKLFEVFFEVGKPINEKEDPFIISQYPSDYNDEEVIKNAPKFAFPCHTERYTTMVDHFTFTLTDLDSKFKFGFVRHSTGAHTCFCIISYLPWFEVFYNFLNIIADIRSRPDENSVTELLHSAYVHEVLGPDLQVKILAGQEEFIFYTPDTSKLPCIPSSRNLTEYYNAVDTEGMMIIFASMLHERRIIVHSKKFSRLTAVIHAAATLLYPMFWQHLFIPVLPSFLIDYLSAPMPFVIGVHTSMLPKSSSELGDAVIVDADKNLVETKYDDLHDLPDEIGSFLKRHMKSDKVKNSVLGVGDIISRTFMLALVRLIGGYRDALKFNEGEAITFCPVAFVQSRPKSMQPFLQNMLQLQIFQQFINDRLDILNEGWGFEDIFEQECLLHADKLNSRTRYDEWKKKMKNQGRKLHKGGKYIWADFKVKASPVMKDAKGIMDLFAQKAGPAMTSALESVKSQSRKAYSKARTKIQDIKRDDVASPNSGKTKVKSAPAPKDRPFTVVGAPSMPQRPIRPSASPSLDNLPLRVNPKVIIRQPSYQSDRFVSHHDSEGNGTTSADDNDLMYTRVSCNLMCDPDIQNIMFKSASAENLPKTDPRLQNSDSNETMTLSSSMEAALDLPYMDARGTLTRVDNSNVSSTNLLEDNDSGIVIQSNSQNSLDKSKSDSIGISKVDITPVSDINPITKQLLLCSKRNSSSPNVSILNDRLTSTNSAKQKWQCAPNKLPVDVKSSHASDNVLIDLCRKSPSQDNQLDDSLEFDQMNSSGDYVLLKEPKTSSSNANNSFRKTSISRTPAIKWESPKRPSIRRNRSPVTPEECPKILFESLKEQTWSQPRNESDSQSVCVQTWSGNTNSLLKACDNKDLDTLHAPSNSPLQPSSITSSSYSCNTHYEQVNINIRKPNNNADKCKHVDFQNPVHNVDSTVSIGSPARPNNISGFIPLHGSQTGPQSQGNVNKSDPLAGLIKLKQANTKQVSMPTKKTFMNVK